MDWLGSVYGSLGAPFPKISMIVAILLGAFGAAGLWMVAAGAYANQQSKAAVQIPASVQLSPNPALLPPTTGPATASGEGSVANTGNGNIIRTDGVDKKKRKE